MPLVVAPPRILTIDLELGTISHLEEQYHITLEDLRVETAIWAGDEFSRRHQE
jgi:hypothetical protein